MRLVLALLLLWPFAALAVGKNQRSLIRAGALFDSTSGELITKVEVLVEGSKILAVGSDLDQTGAQVIDLSAYTVLPGLIDVHTHLLFLQQISESFEDAADQIRRGNAFRLERAKPFAASYLMSGITTVRELGNSGPFGDIVLRDDIAQGKYPGPRIIASGPGLSPVGGQFPAGTVEEEIINQEYQIIKSVDDGVKAVEATINKGAEVIKIFSDGAPGPGSLSIDEMKAIVATAHKRGIKVAAHAIKDDSIANAIEAGVDSIEHGYIISDKNLKLMAGKNIYFVPTDVSRRLATFWLKTEHPDWSDEKIKQTVIQWQAQGAERLKRALILGVKVAAGSDMYYDFSRAGLSQGEAAKELLSAYVEEGMEPSAVLQSATLHAADLLGFKDRLGVIKAGATADLIAVKGDPTANIKALADVAFVMKEGVVAKKLK